MDNNRLESIYKINNLVKIFKIVKYSVYLMIVNLKKNRRREFEECQNEIKNFEDVIFEEDEGGD